MSAIFDLFTWRVTQPPPINDPIAAMFEAVIAGGFILVPAGMVMYSFAYRGLADKERPGAGRFLVGCGLGLLVGLPFGLGWMPFWTFLVCLLATEAANRLKRPRPS